MEYTRVSVKKVLLFIVALLTLLISGSTPYSIEQFESFRKITLVALFLAQIVLISNYPDKLLKLDKKISLVVVGAFAFFFISAFANMTISANYFSKILMFIFFCLVFSDHRNSKQFLRYLYNIIFTISIMSLVFFVALYVLKIPLPYFKLNNGFYKSYFYLFYSADVYRETLGSFVYYRLQGVFWEPGVYGIYLILGIFYYGFIDEEKKKIKLYILVACLLLTASTTGTILGLIVVTILLLMKIKNIKTRLLVLIPLVVLTGIAIYYVWMKKKTGGGGYSASYILRMVDLKSSFDVWKRHFLFGTGYNNVEEFETATIVWQRQNSNGFMNWCMTMGLFGLIVQIFSLIGNVLRNRKGKRIIHIVFAVIYIGINMTEPLITTPLMIMLLSLDYMALINKKNEGFTYGLERKKNSFNLS